MTNTFDSAVDSGFEPVTLPSTGGWTVGRFGRPRKGGGATLELGDAIQRILRRHWGLIALAVIVGLAIPMVAHARDEKRYVATSRLVIDA